MATPGETGTRELNFVEDDRHELRQLEDYITDLRVVLQTKMQTIRRLMKDYQRYCSIRCKDSRSCRCRQVIQEFEEYVNEAQMYLERAGVLQDRVQSVQNLVRRALCSLGGY
jgi:Mg2+ and Co2+ transporter CorA